MREDAMAQPLELLALAFIPLDDAAAVAGQDVERGFEDMLLRNGFSGRRNVQHKNRHRIAAPFDMNNGAVNAKTGPGPGFQCMEIEAEILIDRNAFVVGPIQIWIDHELAGWDGDFGHGCFLHSVNRRRVFTCFWPVS
jgi:hypothetical protein